MNFKRKIFLAFCLSLLCASLSFAQPGGGGGPGGGEPVPITGIEILLAMGGFLGIRKFMNSKKDNK